MNCVFYAGLVFWNYSQFPTQTPEIPEAHRGMDTMWKVIAQVCIILGISVPLIALKRCYVAKVTRPVIRANWDKLNQRFGDSIKSLGLSIWKCRYKGNYYMKLEKSWLVSDPVNIILKTLMAS